MTEPTAAPTPLAPPEVSALTLTAPEPPRPVAATGRGGSGAVRVNALTSGGARGVGAAVGSVMTFLSATGLRANLAERRVADAR